MMDRPGRAAARKSAGHRPIRGDPILGRMPGFAGSQVFALALEGDANFQPGGINQRQFRTGSVQAGQPGWSCRLQSPGVIRHPTASGQPLLGVVPCLWRW